MTRTSPTGGQTMRRLVVVLVVGAVATIGVAAILLTDEPTSATEPAATSISTGSSISRSRTAPRDTLPESASSSAAVAATEPEHRSMFHTKTQIELVFIKGGRFQMGSPNSEGGRLDGESQRSVVVSDFWLGKTEVTREQYARYLKDNPTVPEPKYWTDPRYNQAHQPMVGISWEDAQAYLTWAGLRLPTEAEWEYAARAGTTTAYSSGDSGADLDAVGWHDGNSNYRLREVARKAANAFGLYDMHGNAWEWCSDWYSAYEGDVVQDPVGPADGTRRAVRGGSWDDPEHCARSAHRVGFFPAERFRQVGFRVARSPE